MFRKSSLFIFALFFNSSIFATDQSSDPIPEEVSDLELKIMLQNRYVEIHKLKAEVQNLQYEINLLKYLLEDCHERIQASFRNLLPTSESKCIF